MENGFYTLKGYAMEEAAALTPAMEDYLEMLCRMPREDGARVSELAQRLHVRSSSATKMVSALTREGFLSAEKYGRIFLTEKGRRAGEYLLYRHATVHGFLCAVNGTREELELTEKIEHFLDERTVRNMELMTRRLLGNT